MAQRNSKLTSLSGVSALFLLPPLDPPRPRPLPLPRPLADVTLAADTGVALLSPAPAALSGRGVDELVRAALGPPRAPLLFADIGGGVGILSLVTMLFKTCSRAASYPGVPTCADAFALTRRRISSVEAEKPEGIRDRPTGETEEGVAEGAEGAEAVVAGFRACNVVEVLALVAAVHERAAASAESLV